jgi:microcystin-dependent protein
MSLESATYISQLNSSNPLASDGVQQGDDHLRLIKAALQNTFEAFTDDPLESSQEELDGAVETLAAGTQKSASGGVSAPGMAFKDDTDTGWSNPAADTIKGSVGGVEFVAVASDKKVTFASEITATKLNGPGAVPIGMPCPWFEDTLPDSTLWGDYAWLNGQVIANANTRCPALLARWQDKYGGNGVTTMGVPDARDNVLVGKGTMGGTSAVNRIVSGVTSFVSSTLGAMFGAALHTLTSSQVPATAITGSGTVTPTVGGGNPALAVPVGHNQAILDNSASITPNTTGFVGSDFTGFDTKTVSISGAVSGGGGSHNIVQPSIVCNWIVRLA